MIELDRRLDFYLATPYSQYPRGHEMAFIDAAKLSSKLTMAGISIFCPIVHGHPQSHHGDVPKEDYSIWMPVNFRWAKKCDALLIGKLESWELSFGIAEEIQFFKADLKPIFHIDPETLTIG